MSRLLVGGLALVVGMTQNPNNIGKTVRLIEYFENQMFDDGSVFNVWKCVGSDLTWPDGMPLDYGYFEPKNLMPLGDKQTQDEFKKELDLCHEN